MTPLFTIAILALGLARDPVQIAQAIPTAQPEVGAPATVPPNVVLPAVPAVEPRFRMPVNEKPLPPGGISGIVQEPFVGIALTDAIAMALAKNTDLQVAQQNRLIAAFQIQQAKGPYDVRLQIVPAYSSVASPTLNIFQAGPDLADYTIVDFGSSAQVAARTYGNTQISVNTSASRTNNNITADTYNPYYNTNITLNVTQPLLRGSASDPYRRQLQLSRINANFTDQQALQSASNSLVNVLDTYYDLIAAWRNVAIQEDGLRQALAQSQSNGRLVRQGQAAPVDVVESDTQVDIFQNNVFSALQNVASLQNQFKQLILANPADPIWEANLVPTSPETEVPPEPSLEEVVSYALLHRPEVAQLQDQRRSAQVNIAFAQDLMKPQLDLSGYAGWTGFAGAPTNLRNGPLGAIIPPTTMLPPIPGYTIGKIGQSYTNLFNSKYPEAGVQLTFSFPFGNDDARGEYGAALSQRHQVEVQQTALVQRIQAEARNSIQVYRSARSRLVAASAARQAAERVLAGEQRKFANGQSTTFLVLQRQLNVANQRGSELQAQTDLSKAIVELNRVSGAIFDRYRIDVTKIGTQP